MTVYVDGLLLAIIRPAVTPAQAFSLQPADLLKLMPCVVAKHIPGGGSPDPRFSVSRVFAQVDAYHPTKRGAFDLAILARSGLIAAWRNGSVHDGARITFIGDAPDPAELRLPDQADGFTRYTATYGLSVSG